MQDLHIGDLIVGHDIGFQALQNSQRLFGRPGVRLLDRQLIAGILFRPLLFKRRIIRAAKSSRDTSYELLSNSVACACAANSVNAVSVRYPF